MGKGELSLTTALKDLYQPEGPVDQKVSIRSNRISGKLLGTSAIQKSSQNDVQRGSQDSVDQKAQKYLRLSLAFYKDALGQSKWSFFVALGASVVAVVFFVIFTLSLLKALSPTHTTDAMQTYETVISGISGAISALVAGTCFYVYGVAASQYSAFHARLDRLQRYFIAESLCNSISCGDKDDPACQPRSKLVKTIAKAPLADAQMFVQPLQVGSGSSGNATNNSANGPGNDNPVNPPTSAPQPASSSASQPTPGADSNGVPVQVQILEQIPVETLAQLPQGTLAHVLAQVSPPILAQALVDANVPSAELVKAIQGAADSSLPLSQAPTDVLLKFPALALAQSLVQAPAQSLPELLQNLSSNSLAKTLAQIGSLSS